MSLLWKPCARYFSTMRLLVWDQKRTWEGCGIGRLPDGPSSISMGPNRRRDNALCLRDLTCLRRNDVCQRYVRQATWDASVERWFAPAPHSCKLIPISGSLPAEQQAMETTEASCYGHFP